MSVKDIRRVLQQLNEPNEFQMEEVNLTDNTFFIYKVSNCKIKDMDVRFNDLRPDHTRFDVFINGQFILDHDYIFEQSGKDFLIKFKRLNFDYSLDKWQSFCRRRLKRLWVEKTKYNYLMIIKVNQMT